LSPPRQPQWFTAQASTIRPMLALIGTGPLILTASVLPRPGVRELAGVSR
jgi:hypothetical protein